jgi:MFS transporter, FHS family, glucose/mannose:H+ symporter
MKTFTEPTQAVTPQASRQLRWITYGAFFSFFLFGFLDNFRGPTLPALLNELNLSYSLGGTLLMGSALGFLAACLLTGPLTDLTGKKMAIFLACGCFFVGISVYSLATIFILLALAFIVVGVGFGALEIGSNLMIVELYPQKKGRYLNLLAFFHGAGSMLAPLYAGHLLNIGVSWRQVYQSGMVLILPLFLIFALVKYPRARSTSSTTLNLKELGKSAFTGEMVLYYVVLALYVGAELGTGAWLVEFLQQVKGQSVMRSSLFLSLFFAAITVGRFVGSFWVEQIGYLKIMLYVSCAAMGCVAVGTFAPPVLVWCLPLAGGFFSIMFPTVTAAVSDLHRENIGTIFGLLFMFAGLGGMFGPWFIGVVSDWLGIQWGFGLVTLYCLAMIVALLRLLARSRERRRA